MTNTGMCDATFQETLVNCQIIKKCSHLFVIPSSWLVVFVLKDLSALNGIYIHR